jgi:hypothetical protein
MCARIVSDTEDKQVVEFDYSIIKTADYRIYDEVNGMLSWHCEVYQIWQPILRLQLLL